VGSFFSEFRAREAICRLEFRIKDPKRPRAQSQVRKNSLLESSDSKRQRAKSQAVLDLSSSSVPEFVLQLLHHEFKVFEPHSDASQKQALVSAALVLKAVNFLLANSEIFSPQGVSLLLRDEAVSSQEWPVLGLV
jgi:hypothetical protein